jgi:DegV family protein with EDD domain
MNKYVIYTDSACDITPDILADWGVKYLPLTFKFNDEDKIYDDFSIPHPEFYNRMRNGGIAKTSALNSETIYNAVLDDAKAGNDIIYLGFSSGLSTTFNSGRMALERLAEEFPEQKFIAFDTLCASAGQGLLLYFAVQKKNEGATIDDVLQLVTDLRFKLCHWFTVDDLEYLKRGGRISPTVAFVGNVLGIKPVLHMDNEGHLINMFKVRGRKTSVTALADKYTELADDKENGTVFISQGDCMADAELLASIIKQRHGAEVKIITDVGPVIGAHTGPGVLALFFIGKER